MDEKTRKMWLEDTAEIMADVKAERKPYTADIFGKEIIVLPDVFSPKYFTDAAFFAEIVPTIATNGTFCEIGVGTGVVSLFVALTNKDVEITATDINPAALKNTRQNFEKYNKQVTLYEGSVFEPIPTEKKFDYIFWNHPFNKADKEVTDVLNRSVLDHNFDALRAYFKDAHSYLAKDGTLILGTGELADQKEVLTLAKEYDWKKTKEHTRGSTSRVGGNTPMQLYVYEFKKEDHKNTDM